MTILCFLYCQWLNSLLWFENSALKDVSARPKYISVPLFALFLTSAWYIRISVRHWFFNGQFSVVLQLQPCSVILGPNTLLWCDEINNDRLLVQLQLTFTGMLLRILCNLLGFGKCCFNNFRNVLPIFVSTLIEQARLIQIILWFVFRMETKVSLSPFFLNASIYIDAAFWKISLLDDRSDSLWLINWVNSLKSLFLDG